MTPQSCTPQPVTLPNGGQFIRTCGIYQGCALFKAMDTTGKPISGLSFFLSTEGQPMRDYPGAGRCVE